MLSACGQEKNQGVAASSAAPKTSESPTLSGYCAEQAPEMVTGSAVAEFGQNEMTALYCDLVDFTFDAGYNATRLKTPDAEATVEDFAFVHEYMAPRLQAEFDQNVAVMLAGDETAMNEVNKLVFNGATWGAKTLAFPEVDAVRNRHFSGPQVNLVPNDGDPSQPMLRVTFEAGADVNVLVDGAPYAWSPVRSVDLTLVHNDGPGRPWLIDSVASTFTNPMPQPRG